jgi:uncharacterized protein
MGLEMLFRRKKPADLWDRMRTALWPRRSFGRSAQYFSKRVLRLTATPHSIAAGVAAGTFASFTPLMGFHFIIAGVVAYVLRGNLIASAIGTAFGNPLTFPLIWGSSLALGRLVLFGQHPEEVVPLHIGRVLGELDFVHIWEPLIKPMMVGGVILGSIFGVTLYMLTLWALNSFREQRRRRLAEKAKIRAGLAVPQAPASS